MSVVEVLAELGGVASRRTVVRLTSRGAVRRAIEAGDVLRCGRSGLALREIDASVRIAVELGGVLSHDSAALHHGWAVASVPRRPHVTVPRWRVVDARQGARAVVHFAQLRPDEIDGVATTPEVTLVSCLRHGSLGAALAVADSARRAGVGHETMRRLADEARGPGSPQIRRVAHHASPLAANPFESVLRAVSLDVPGLELSPQVWIPAVGARPDLVDTALRIVVEADSFEWHGGRAALARDARRYNRLVVDGWLVLRFSWEDVMLDPDGVREVLVAAVQVARDRKKVAPRGRSVA